MMNWMIIILHIDAFLPLTEAVQAIVCMMGDFQILLITDKRNYINFKLLKYIKWENCVKFVCMKHDIIIELKEVLLFIINLKDS